MCKYVVLLKFTEQGIANVGESLDRAEAFKDAAARAGATVEGQYWTTGPYDGVVILNAPDEATAAGLVLKLGQDTNVTTCMLRTFGSGELKNVLGKMS
ncbi:MAG TPA: GYD domain-containing protein [Phycisphaerae bacterium]|nr:GYD domain-containing protein [Phycisphaerae bacterium]